MSLTDESALSRLEHSWLEPPYERMPTCKCGEYPQYEICNELFCDDCMSEVADYVLPFDAEECVNCEEMSDEGYKVYGDFYCLDCFKKQFGI